MDLLGEFPQENDATTYRCTSLNSLKIREAAEKPKKFQMNSIRPFSYVVLALLLIPVIVLLYEGFGPLRSPEGYSMGVFLSIGMTLLACLAAVVTIVVLYTPIAYFFARGNTIESKGMQTLSDIPASIPHPIVGIALLLLASPITPLGKFLISIGFDLFQTFLGLIVALVIVSAPIYIKAMQPFFESMNRSYENYALGLGASRLRTFLSVVLPRSGRGIFSASLISASRALSEYGSISIIAYIIIQPRQFFGLSPVQVLIVSFYIGGNIRAAVTCAAVTIVVALAIMLPLRFVQMHEKFARS
jgi:molybdate/tungstate transport system permease protein